MCRTATRREMVPGTFGFSSRKRAHNPWKASAHWRGSAGRRCSCQWTVSAGLERSRWLPYAPVNIESRSADCFVASAVRFPRKTIDKEEGYFTFLAWRGYRVDVLDEAERDGEAKNAPARHALRYGSWHIFLSRTIRRKASCCRSRRRRCIGTAIGLLLSEIRQEHQNVAHRNHADQFPTLRHAEMSDMGVGHQIADI